VGGHPREKDVLPAEGLRSFQLFLRRRRVDPDPPARRSRASQAGRAAWLGSSDQAAADHVRSLTCRISAAVEEPLIPRRMRA
jgi:hypothetical protein